MTTDLVTLFGLTSLISMEDGPKDLGLSDLDQMVSVYTTAITPEGEGNVTCYQPVLANNSSSDELCRTVIAKPVFISARTERKSLSDFVIDRGNLTKLDYDKTIFSGKITALEGIGDLLLEPILNYVAGNGSLYTITDDQLLIKDILTLWLPTSFSKFKFSSVLKCISNNELSVVSKPQLIISFHDLRSAIPIFDRTHVEGVAVDVRLFLEHEKRIFDVVRCWYLLSNYEENVLYIDGEELCAQSSITSRKSSELLHVTEDAFNKYHKLQKKVKLEEVVKELKSVVPPAQNSRVIKSSVLPFTNNNSSSASFYINGSATTWS